MPKLSKAVAKKVADTEGGSFEPLEPGVYHVRLVNVDGSREGPAGPYWSWEFDVVEPGSSGKLWNNTSLSEKAYFKLKETFEAFGEDTDTDTDDLIGEIVKAVVSTRVIQQGDKKGQVTNQIDKLVPADEDFTPNDSAKDDDLDI